MSKKTNKKIVFLIMPSQEELRGLWRALTLAFTETIGKYILFCPDMDQLSLLLNRRKLALNAIASLAVVGVSINILAMTYPAILLTEQRVAQAELQRLEPAEVSSVLKQKIGMSPQNIVQLYSAAIAEFGANWRLFDQTTGRPVFQKTITRDKKTLPLFVKLPSNNMIVPYLTLEDERRSNRAIGGQIRGTAFVVNEQGFLFTTKRLAAAWLLPFYECACNDNKAWLVEEVGAHQKSLRWSEIDLNNDSYKSVKAWVPVNEGVLFDSNVTRALKPGNISAPKTIEHHVFIGRNDLLEVTFSGSRLPLSGVLIRYSDENDVALIKVKSSQALASIKMVADDKHVDFGETISVVYFPKMETKTMTFSTTLENGRNTLSDAAVPNPYVTEGIVAAVSPKLSTNAETDITSSSVKGDFIAVTVNSMGAGGSGAPVFNSAGEVIGIYTRVSDGSRSSSVVVPIKYGRELLEPR